MTTPDDYTTVYTKDGDYHLSQFTSGESSEEYIWMDRNTDELLECEVDEVQKLIGRLELDGYLE